MKPSYISDHFLQNFIRSALDEDLQSGDHSTLATIDAKAHGQARLLIKESGILAGLEVFIHVFKFLDPEMSFEIHRQDGDPVVAGDVALTIRGNIRAILSGERLALNCIQRMSGIASYTHSLCMLLEGTGTKLLDTRKTTPLIRLLEKWAVLLGGGQNHRIGLFDMIMLKDNHIDYAGGIEKAVASTKNYLDQNNLDLKIEVETRTLDEVMEALDCGGVDVVMLDNMDLVTMRKAVGMIRGRAKSEASGGITEENIRSIAETGVDYISVGALTHSVKSLDISLKAEIK